MVVFVFLYSFEVEMVYFGRYEVENEVFFGFESGCFLWVVRR